MPDIYQRVIAFNQNRDAQFLPIKYQLMSMSAFRFFRGSCHLFYEDLSAGKTWKDSVKTWICGDLHLENFGTYRSQNQVVYFDLNDFDEAILGHPTWELTRFLCSIYLAGEDLKITKSELKKIVKNVCEEYLATMREGKAYSIEKETVQGILKKYIEMVATRDESSFINSRTVLKADKKRRIFIDQKKYFSIADKGLKKQLLEDFSDYLKPYQNETKTYQIFDVAMRVAGTGSIGLNRYAFLVYCKQDKAFQLFDVKQAQDSSLNIAPFLDIMQPSWKNQAVRVTTIQTYMQYVTPAWLSTFNFRKQSYMVKQLQPDQDKIQLTTLLDKPKKFSSVCQSMARLMAYAQLRSAGRNGSDNIDELITFAENAHLWKAQLLEYTYNYYLKVLQDYAEFYRIYTANELKK